MVLDRNINQAEASLSTTMNACMYDGRKSKGAMTVRNVMKPNGYTFFDAEVVISKLATNADATDFNVIVVQGHTTRGCTHSPTNF
ncbi:hypothetical protein CJF32_00009264 [Rutstroemia sp. NJR-2017a WRK4]|nr:hypothetical protein CJF32_00009264 [Rutstroemia sp. NJR-2017a WRK4]